MGEFMQPFPGHTDQHEHPPEHGQEGEDHSSMMSMFFHAGTSETVLFEFWKTENTWAFIGSLIIIFLMAFFYEAIKFYRELLYQQAMTASTRGSTGSSSGHSTTSLLQGARTKMFTSLHVFQTILHVLQFVLSYFLMLIFMTYNVWLALAVTLGAGVGFFTFGWNKNVAVDITEHCQ